MRPLVPICFFLLFCYFPIFFRSLLELRAININDNFCHKLSSQFTNTLVSDKFTAFTAPLHLVTFSNNHSTKKYNYRCGNVHPFISIAVHSSSPFLRLDTKTRNRSIGWATCSRIALWVPACGDIAQSFGWLLNRKAMSSHPWYSNLANYIVPSWCLSLRQDSERCHAAGWLCLQELAEHYLHILLNPASSPMDVLECNICSVWHLIPYLSHMFLTKINLIQ